jgi:hypothetical protein
MNPNRYTMLFAVLLCGCASKAPIPSVAPVQAQPAALTPTPTERDAFEAALKADIAQTIDKICKHEDKFKDEITYPALLEYWKFNMGALSAKHARRIGEKPSRRDSAELVRFLYEACMDYARERKRLPSDFTTNDATLLAQFAIDAKVPISIERPDDNQAAELAQIAQERQRLQAANTADQLKLSERLKDVSAKLAEIEAQQKRAKAAQANKLAEQIPPLIEEQTRLQKLLNTHDKKPLDALDAREKQIRAAATKPVLLDDMTEAERATVKP